MRTVDADGRAGGAAFIDDGLSGQRFSPARQLVVLQNHTFRRLAQLELDPVAEPPGRRGDDRSPLRSTRAASIRRQAIGWGAATFARARRCAGRETAGLVPRSVRRRTLGSAPHWGSAMEFLASGPQRAYNPVRSSVPDAAIRGVSSGDRFLA